jgi:hypothetical protein
MSDKNKEPDPEVPPEQVISDKAPAPSSNAEQYAARLEIDFPDGEIDRMEVVLRIFKLIPALIMLITIVGTLFLSTVIMLVVRQKYPRWWFDFNLEAKRYSKRVFAYATLMSNEYPSTTEEQYVHLEIDFPGEDVSASLNRWAPLYKIILGIPHFLCLFGLFIATLAAIIGVYVTILFTGRYPKALFDFIVGFLRWELRFEAYVLLLVTDKYPPFSLSS